VRPGDLVRITRFDDTFLGIYLGPNQLNTRNRWRFLVDGKVVHLDLANKLVYSWMVIS
jgi:hypothetical protein